MGDGSAGRGASPWPEVTAAQRPAGALSPSEFVMSAELISCNNRCLDERELTFEVAHGLACRFEFASRISEYFRDRISCAPACAAETAASVSSGEALRWSCQLNADVDAG